MIVCLQLTSNEGDAEYWRSRRNRRGTALGHLDARGFVCIHQGIDRAEL